MKIVELRPSSAYLIQQYSQSSKNVAIDQFACTYMENDYATRVILVMRQQIIVNEVAVDGIRDNKVTIIEISNFI